MRLKCALKDMEIAALKVKVADLSAPNAHMVVMSEPKPGSNINLDGISSMIMEWEDDIQHQVRHRACVA
jgi:hypothetical protein